MQCSGIPQEQRDEDKYSPTERSEDMKTMIPQEPLPFLPQRCSFVAYRFGASPKKRKAVCVFLYGFGSRNYSPTERSEDCRRCCGLPDARSRNYSPTERSEDTATKRTSQSVFSSRNYSPTERSEDKHHNLKVKADGVSKLLSNREVGGQAKGGRFQRNKVVSKLLSNREVGGLT